VYVRERESARGMREKGAREKREKRERERETRGLEAHTQTFSCSGSG